MLTAKTNSGTALPPIEPGTYEAVCYTIADLGTEHSEVYQNDSRKVVLIWEIPALRIQVKNKETNEVADLPKVISKRYTLSLSEKANLRHDLASWRGKDFTPDEEKAFDLKKVLGAPCMLSIMHKYKTDGSPYAVINAVIPLKKKMKPENPMVIYGIEENGKNLPETLPDWIKEQIKRSPEYQEIVNPQTVDEPPVTDDDAVAAETEDDDSGIAF